MQQLRGRPSLRRSSARSKPRSAGASTGWVAYPPSSWVVTPRDSAGLVREGGAMLRSPVENGSLGRPARFELGLRDRRRLVQVVAVAHHADADRCRR